MNTTKETKYRCGDVRKDGKVFWAYNRNCINGEYWLTQEKWNLRKHKNLNNTQNWRANNKEKCNELARNWARNNQEKIKAKRIKDRAYNSKYQSAYIKRRSKEDPVYALQIRIRNRIRGAFYENGYTKRSRAHEVLGCSFDFFKKYIEQRFQEKMTWENKSEWHLDHIIPISSAKTEEDVIKLNHYSNFQPLWAQQNLLKSNKVTNSLKYA